MHHEQQLARIVEALDRAGWAAVVTLGGGLDPGTVSAPRNGVVCEWAPHETLLAHADAVITHAGMGTTLAALATGVPLVCMPLGRDQPETAERVAALGAGVAITREAGPGEIAAALERVLSDPSYRRAARHLSERVTELGRGERAVELVEELLGASRDRGLQPAVN
jgi:MGT family glycosyltransferase